jgi:hypothetical protein
MERHDVWVTELGERARLALKTEERVAARVERGGGEDLHGHARRRDAVDREDHARVWGRRHLADGLVAPIQERAGGLLSARRAARSIALARRVVFGDPERRHLIARALRGVLKPELGEATREQRQRRSPLGRRRGQLLERPHGRLGAAVPREQLAEQEARAVIVRVLAERRLERARAVGRSP